jgi:opacity protein-like surface antigen
MSALCLAAGLAVVAAPSMAAAAGAQPWFSFTPTWSTYSLTDVNTLISGLNASLADSGFTGHMHEIKHGAGFGVSSGVDFPGGFTLAVAFDRLLGSTRASDGSSSIAVKVPANAFTLRGLYRFPSRGACVAGVGLGAGRVSERGGIELTDASALSKVAFDLKGSGPVIEGFVTGDFWPGRTVALSGSAGYRYAKVTELRLLDQTLYNPADGSKLEADYSGFVLRAGLRVGPRP